MSIKESIQKFQKNQPVNGAWNLVRESGFNYFLKHGLPSKRLEQWHYTSLKNFPEESLSPIDFNAKKIGVLENFTNDFLYPQFYSIVFIDGKWAKNLSSKKLPKGMLVSSIGSKKSLSIMNRIRRARQQAGTVQQDALEALNSAFLYQGIAIQIAPNLKIAKPVHILNIKTTACSNYSRVLVDIGAGSSIKLIESYTGNIATNTSNSFMNNSVCEINLNANANLEYVRLQAEDLATTHFGVTRFYLEAFSSLRSLNIAAGAKLGRNNLAVYCLGSGSQAEINGLSLSSGEQHLDNNTLIDHVVGQCTTSQLYKSVLAGNSRAVFSGRVQIRSGAQKAESTQLNQNLLLSQTAEADSKPELGIFADDVKASHGSTIGQVSEEEIFYLMSRAISRESAVEMLSLGFVQELVEKVEYPPLREWLTKIVGLLYLKIGKLEQ